MQPDRNTNLEIGILGKSGLGFQNMVYQKQSIISHSQDNLSKMDFE